MTVHLYHWHQTQFDTNYPDYFPEKSGLKDFVSELQDAGIVVMPYINGRLWDVNAPSFDDTAANHAVTQSAERANPCTRFLGYEHYGNGQRLVGMCMHSEFWRKKIVGLCRRIVNELGCGGIYIDQLGCFGSAVCLNPSHGHPLGGGEYWLAGYRKLMAAIRGEIGPEPILTTENNWEGCVADFDALLDTNWDNENNLPIFPAVYWGRNSIFGGSARLRNDGGAELFAQSAGMRFVWGGQFGWGHFEPLLEEKHRELLDYFTELCRLRTEFARFFCRGEFLRPPAVRLAATGEFVENPLKGPVLAATYSDPDAPRAAVFLVNVTRREIEVDVEITDTAWQNARPEGLPLVAGKDSAPVFRVRLPALGSMAVPLQ